MVPFWKGKPKAAPARGWSDSDGVVFRFSLTDNQFVFRKPGEDLSTFPPTETPQGFAVPVEDASMVARLGGRAQHDALDVWMRKGLRWPDGRRIFFTVDALVRHGVLATQGLEVGAQLGLGPPMMRNMVLCGSPHYYYSTTEEALIRCPSCKEQATHFMHHAMKGDTMLKFVYCSKCGHGLMGWASLGVAEMDFSLRSALGAGPKPTKPWAVVGKLERALTAGDWTILHQRGTANFYPLKTRFVGQLSYVNGTLYFVNSLARESISCAMGSIIPHSQYYPISPTDLAELKDIVAHNVGALLGQPELVPWRAFHGGLSFFWDTSGGDQGTPQRLWGTVLTLNPAGKYVDASRQDNHQATWLSVYWY